MLTTRGRTNIVKRLEEGGIVLLCATSSIGSNLRKIKGFNHEGCGCSVHERSRNKSVEGRGRRGEETVYLGR